MKKGDQSPGRSLCGQVRKTVRDHEAVRRLRQDSPYKKDDMVRGTIYETSGNFGVFVAVDDCYSALIPKREAYGDLKVGRQIEARVTESTRTVSWT